MRNNTIIILTIILLSLSFISAVADLQTTASEQSRKTNKETSETENKTQEQLRLREQEISEIKERASSNVYQIQGKNISIQRIKNQVQLKINQSIAKCNCNLTQEFDPIQNRTMLKLKLSNGRNSEIKIMPDTASETALTRLRLKNCNEENNCTIELKEVGNKNQTRAAYEIKTKRNSRLFWIFKKQMRVEAQVDAENGELIRTQKPWWAFLASEPKE